MRGFLGDQNVDAGDLEIPRLAQGPLFKKAILGGVVLQVHPLLQVVGNRLKRFDDDFSFEAGTDFGHLAAGFSFGCIREKSAVIADVATLRG